MVKVNIEKKTKPTYPWVGRLKEYTAVETVVLFTKESTGMVLYTTDSEALQEGYILTDWDEGQFEPCKITLDSTC